jgi:cathepsin C
LGRWTLIYDQGFELNFGGNKYFAYFNYTKSGSQITSNCDRTFTGWYHDSKVNSNNWGCFRASKTSQSVISVQNIERVPLKNVFSANRKFQQDASYVDKINKMNLGWTAKVYPQFEGKTVADMQRMAGAKKVDQTKRAAMKATSKLFRSLAQREGRVSAPMDLPREFDWRNVSGINYVSPVRDQQSCGSCYAFATMAMFEARVRVASKGKETPVFSPQDVVDCCGYSQGCDGGFPYLVAKYAEDFGLTVESCDPYQGEDSACINQCPQGTPRLYGADDYYYVGGYYGATNAQNMMEELVKNGPIAIGFMVYNDFFSYSGGVYKHKSALKALGPDPHFEETNHAVLIVGYGETNAGEKYWIVKNSWGTGWGVAGYFMIERGTDNCDVESLAVSAKPFANAP